MNTEEKIKLSITLDEYESKLLRAATKIALPHCIKELEPSDFRRMMRLALWAFLRGVIKENKKVQYPVVAVLRDETAEEQGDRIAWNIPKPASDWTVPNRWN